MKNTNLQTIENKRKQAGFTLLEVLVALALGVGILTAAITMQLQHRKGFKQSSNKLTMQTNAKFAFEFIGQSIRSAGSMGCKNGLALKGESVNLKDQCIGSVCSSFVQPFDDTNVSYADFRPGFEIKGYEWTGGQMVPDLLGGFSYVSTNLFNPGSDIISISGGYGEVYKVVEDNSPLLPLSASVSIDKTNAALDNIRLKQSQYAILSSCEGAYVFKITSDDAQIKAGTIFWAGGGSNGDDNATGNIGEKAAKVVGSKSREIRRAAVVSYFVGDDKNGIPTLYQDVDGVSSRLVDGVEEMHILYGLSENTAFSNVADRYVKPSVIVAESDPLANPPINKWDKVVTVRIGLILRSRDPVFESDQTQTNLKLNCVDYDYTAPTDKYFRKAYCADISMRNRLVGARVSARSK